MSLSAQSKVLRVLQEGIINRVGAARPVQVDVRILAATNKNLEDEIADSRFREDLFYRLNVVPISVPALRERLEDVPALIEHFVATLSVGTGVAPRPFTPDAIKALQRRSWPGNVRELRNAVERLLILAAGKQITAGDVARLLPSADGGISPHLAPETGRTGTLEDFQQDAERTFLLIKLREFNWNVAETARALDMPRSNLYKKIERYRLTREET
jgi:two-component system nitrogen regulation response regulator NtrX